MRGGGHKQGYTIVEVMIFLAISGVMFLVAATFINGKQAQGEFRDSMDDINSQIRQTLNDVSNGFYPSNSDFSCTAGNALNAPLNISTGTANDQGTNQGCAFIGKVIQFGVGTTPGSDYNIYSVAGRQFQTDNKSLLPPATFQQAQPIAMTGDGGTPNLTQIQTLKWRAEVTKMTDNGGAIGAFGFFSGFAAIDSDNELDSGAAPPIAVTIPASALGRTSTDMYNWIKGMGSASAPAPNLDPHISICFKGTNSQYGLLTIGTNAGNNGQKLATHVQISRSPTGGCPS